MKGRATIIHRQGTVDVAVCSVPMDDAPRTFSNLVKAMKERAQSAWGVPGLGYATNNDIVNGKRDGFTIDERKKLKEALDTIAYEIQTLSDNL